jgi:hypothetical protein
MCRTLEISRFVLLAGSEKAERLPAINIMKLVIDGYKDIGVLPINMILVNWFHYISPIYHRR